MIFKFYNRNDKDQETIGRVVTTSRLQASSFFALCFLLSGCRYNPLNAPAFPWLYFFSFYAHFMLAM